MLKLILSLKFIKYNLKGFRTKHGKEQGNSKFTFDSDLSEETTIMQNKKAFNSETYNFLITELYKTLQIRLDMEKSYFDF